MALVACVALWGAVPARAHVGSPDIYAEGTAGPYRLLVTVRPPQVIPGVAEIEVRAAGAGPGAPRISAIEMAPIPLYGEASKHPPVADAMKRSNSDAQFFSGALWIMASGSWQIRFSVQGSQATGVLSIPVPATSSSTRGMDSGLGILLGALGLLLIAGVVGIVGAAAREAQLAPGDTPSTLGRRNAWIAMGVTAVLMIGAIVGGKLWWNDEASDYAKYVYKPLTMQAAVDANHTLRLNLHDPGWLKNRRIDDFVPDHDHLMHLYLIRQPGLDVVFHLHPAQVAPGQFELAMPSIPGGDYRLYADVVHTTGFPETLVTELPLTEITGHALDGDDAKGVVAPLGPPQTGCPSSAALGPQFHLPDGYSMIWNNASVLPAKTPEVLEFSLLDHAGKPAPDMALYMGMVGHAAFVKDDGTVFAHVHPSGTVSMAALMMAAAQNQPSAAKTDDMASMPGMQGTNATNSSPNAAAIPNNVGFPYGFPTPGAYRIFVQMRHGQTIETAAFDACAIASAAN